MTVKEFMTTQHGDIDALNIKTFVSTIEKTQAVNRVISTRLIDTEDDTRITATYNTVTKEILCLMTGISLYTDLDATSVEDYDLLVESGLLDEIIRKIGDDFRRYYSIFEQRFEDYLRETNSIDGVIERVLKKATDAVNGLDIETIKQYMQMFESMSK